MAKVAEFVHIRSYFAEVSDLGFEGSLDLDTLAYTEDTFKVVGTSFVEASKAKAGTES